jgi:hypothetical protein
MRLMFYVLFSVCLTASAVAQTRQSNLYNSSGIRLDETIKAGANRDGHQTIQQWIEDAKSARSKEKQQQTGGALNRLAARKDLPEKDRAAIRAIALEFAEDDGEFLRTIACFMLANVGDKSCVKSLHALLDDSSLQVRIAAVRATAKLHDETTVAALVKHVDKYGNATRGIDGSAIESLLAIGTADARAALESFYENRPEMKELAAKALDALDDREKVKRKK